MILDGKKLSQRILDSLKKEIKEKQLKLKLAVVLVGKNRVSKTYIQNKKQACSDIGIDFELFKFPLDIDEEGLKQGIIKIVQDPANSGIIIQLPLPKNINSQKILNLIPPEKDIDALSKKDNSFVLSPVVKAVSYLLKEYSIDIKNKEILLIGKGRLVGRPLAAWLSKQGVDFKIVDKSSGDISSFISKADLIISGAGEPNLITGGMVKQGVIIIDAGSSSESGKIQGDIDFKGVSKKAQYITPVPGGVGPVTVACLLENLVKLKCR